MHKLTHFKLCPLSRSIRLCLVELGMSFHLDEQHAWEGHPSFLAMNPAGELPVLSLETGEALCGAYAISEFLAEQYSAPHQSPLGLTLFPGDSIERAEVRRLVDWFHRKFFWEVTNEFLIDKIYPRVSSANRAHSPDAARLRNVRRNLRYHMSYIGYLADQRNWLAGETLSFADLAAAAHLSTIDYVSEIDWDANPSAKDWYARIKSRPSFRPLLQERIIGPDPPKHYSELDF